MEVTSGNFQLEHNNLPGEITVDLGRSWYVPVDYDALLRGEEISYKIPKGAKPGDEVCFVRQEPGRTGKDSFYVSHGIRIVTTGEEVK